MTNQNATLLLDNNSRSAIHNSVYMSLLNAGFSVQEAVSYIAQRFWWFE